MATVYFGKLSGPVGFSRVVAIKRMHPRLASDPQFVAMFLDEATLASRVHHPNVVATLDVVAEENETFLVMDYVRGPSLSSLLTAAARAREPVPIAIATGILAGVLAGLHAAHEACDKKGKPLGLVHRDVSPHNVLVGADGVPRIMDFGVAKAARRLHVTQEGQLKGKLSYMAPEQIQGGEVDRRADVFAAGVVLWTTLAGRRLFRGDDIAETMTQVLSGEIPRISAVRSDVPEAVDAAVATALERDRTTRFSSAREFASALEAAGPIASARAIGEWVQRLAGEVLAEREAVIAEIEDTEIGGEPASAESSPDGDVEATIAEGAGNAGRERREPEASMSGAPTVELPRPPPVSAEPIAEEAATQTELALPERAPPAPTSLRRWVLGMVLVAASVIALAGNIARQSTPSPSDASPSATTAAAGSSAPIATTTTTPTATTPAAAAATATSTSSPASSAPATRPIVTAREPRVTKPRPVASARPAVQPAAPGDPGYLPPRP